jgi:hypothetical protein
MRAWADAGAVDRTVPVKGRTEEIGEREINAQAGDALRSDVRTAVAGMRQGREVIATSPKSL